MAIKNIKDIIKNKGYFVDQKDRKIFEEGDLQSFFGFGDKDAIEFIVYDTNNNQLPQADGSLVRYISLTSQNINDYFLIAEGTVFQQYNLPKEYFIDVERLLREAGYNNGIFKTQVTLINKRVGSEKEFDKLWIQEISPSRTEVRLLPLKPNGKVDAKLQERFDIFVNNKDFRDDTEYYGYNAITSINPLIIDDFLSQKYGESFVKELKEEYNIPNVDAFCSKVYQKFIEAATYEFQNKVSDVGSRDYGKRKPNEQEASLSKTDIINICKKILIQVVNFYLYTPNVSNTSRVVNATDSSQDAVNKILQSYDASTTYTTSTPTIERAKQEKPVLTQKELQYKKEAEKESPYPAKDTLIKMKCIGLDKYATYADGAGGTYDLLIEENSVECGYTPPNNGGGGGSVGGGGGGGPRGGGGGGDIRNPWDPGFGDVLPRDNQMNLE